LRKAGFNTSFCLHLIWDIIFLSYRYWSVIADALCRAAFDRRVSVYNLT